MSATRRTLIVLATSTWLMCVQPAIASPQSQWTEDEYRALVLAYRSGDRDAVRRLQQWPRDRLAAVVGHVDVPGRWGWDGPALIAAVQLLTEAALRPFDVMPEAVPDYLTMASSLLGRGPSSMQPFASRWYVAAARLLCDSACGTAASDLLARGRAQWPGDASVLCESGRLSEYLAGNPRALGPATPQELFGLEDPRTWQGRRSKRTYFLSRAAGWLGAGVDADPSDALCRLHFGRVLSLLGRNEEADSVLTSLQQDEDDAVSYLASMFLGGAAERRGDLTAAESHYRAAISRFARGQAAYVALSCVLVRSGRVAEARAVLAESVNGVADDRRDGWWWYHLDPSRAVEARLEAVLSEGLAWKDRP